MMASIRAAAPLPSSRGERGPHGHTPSTDEGSANQFHDLLDGRACQVEDQTGDEYGLSPEPDADLATGNLPKTQEMTATTSVQHLPPHSTPVAAIADLSLKLKESNEASQRTATGIPKGLNVHTTYGSESDVPALPNRTESLAVDGHATVGIDLALPNHAKDWATVQRNEPSVSLPSYQATSDEMDTSTRESIGVPGSIAFEHNEESSQSQNHRDRSSHRHAIPAVVTENATPPIGPKPENGLNSIQSPGVIATVSPAGQILSHLASPLAELADASSAAPTFIPARHLKIALHPQDLGAVNVTMMLRGQQMSVVIEVREGVALRMLQRDRQVLDDMLQSVTPDGTAPPLLITIRGGDDAGRPEAAGTSSSSDPAGQKSPGSPGQAPDGSGRRSIPGKLIESGRIQELEIANEDGKDTGTGAAGVIVV